VVWQGIPHTLGPYVDATTLESAKQTIAVGPVASQIAIKMLGTNGGGFFNANAAHPFENPTALANYVQIISIFALGAALTNVFGRMVGNQKQGWAVLWTAVAMLVPSAVAAMNNPGPHGFTEVLYVYVSQDGNNGSAFAGLSANTLFYNLSGAMAMAVGRFWMIIPTMIIAGSLASKKLVPASTGTFPTTGGLFVGLVVGVIVIVGGLTFFPALALGPIVEQLALNAGTLFSSN
jgi:K+-transporting ATPase A subunit